jgi:flavocytochrome c
VIILATGGYAYDFENEDSLLKEYAEHLMKFPTTNGKFSKGEGIKIARRIGAELIQMGNIQMHPTGFVDMSDRYNKNKILAPELLRGVGGILINQQGKRFCNELGRRDYVTQQTIMHCDKVNVNDEHSAHIDQYEAFVLLNDEMVKSFGKNIEFYINKKLIRKYKDVTAFAKEFGVDDNNLRKTINEYKESMVQGVDEFGKVVFGGEFKYDDEVYVGVVTPSIHYTMGGIKINNNAEVVNKKGRVINGLFAAGEVTGGVHGGNRLGGNSLLECAVFGKIAGQSALDYLLKLDY